MAIVAEFDVHRAQITFDAVDTDSREVMRGRIDATPAAVTRWARRFRGRESHVAVEACTGWLFVCDALAAAGACWGGGGAGVVCSSVPRSRPRARWRIWPSRWRRARCVAASGEPRLI